MKPCLIYILKAFFLCYTSSFAQQVYDLSTLPPDEQTLIKELKFKDVDVAPAETRRFTFIKTKIKVVNSSRIAPILGKLKLEANMLMKTPQNQWYVLKCAADFVIPEKGTNEIQVSFGESNKKFEEITGDKKTKPADTRYVIYYNGTRILESAPDKTGKFPSDWWKMEGLLGPNATITAPSNPTTNVAEFETLRRTYEQQLRTQVWRIYEQSANDLRTRYVAALDKAMKASQTAGQLDEALELHKEKDSVMQTGKVSDQKAPVTAPSLATLRNSHQNALAALKASRDKSAAPIVASYQQKVALLIQRLTQSGKLYEAKAVRDAENEPLILDQ